MNCRHCHTLLLREADQLGTVQERAELEAHLAACPDCRSLQADLRKLAQEVRDELHAGPVPDATEAWQRMHRELQRETPVAAPRRRPAALWWFAPPLAAATALALLVFVPSPGPVPHNDPAVDAAGYVTARAEYVEPGDAAAATMVFVDKPSGWLVVWASDTPPARKG